MTSWLDISSFSRDAVDRTPRSFELQAGLVRVTVTRLVGRSGWYLRCPALGWTEVRIPCVELIDAKHIAQRWVADELLRAARVLAHAEGSDTQPLTPIGLGAST